MRVTRRLAALSKAAAAVTSKTPSQQPQSQSQSQSQQQQAAISRELLKLLPFLPSTSSLTTTTTTTTTTPTAAAAAAKTASKTSSSAPQAPTAASLIIATAHCTSRAQIAHAHGERCAVQAADIPLSALAAHDSLAARCGFCVQRRVHFLASELFCLDFAQRCRREDKKTKNEQAQDKKERMKTVGQSDEVLPSALREAVLHNFPSVQAFLDELVLFVRSAHSPGRTWIVYKPPPTAPTAAEVKHVMEGVVLMNLSLNETPLVFGLWPLAVIEGTEARLCAMYCARHARRYARDGSEGGDEEKEKVKGSTNNNTTASSPSSSSLSLLSTARSTPPAWSRAARNPASAVVAYWAAEEETTAAQQRTHTPHTLDALRLGLAQAAVAEMNWAFVERQWAGAVEYYHSAQRRAWRAAERQRLTQCAVSEAIRSHNAHVVNNNSGAHVSGGGGGGGEDSVGPHSADGVKATTRRTQTKKEGDPRSDAHEQEEKLSAASSEAAEGDTRQTDKPAATAVESTDKQPEHAQEQHEQQEQQEEATVRATNTMKEETSNTSTSTTPAAGTTTTTTRATTTTSEANSVEEPVVTQRADGTWEYRFRNGDVTLVHGDGRKVFITAAVQTTVYPDGSTLFVYPNGSSIHDRADGTRTTTFADGTVKTERRPEQ